MPKQEQPLSQQTPQKSSQGAALHTVKAKVQETSSKPDKKAPVPKYEFLANERMKNE
ncbi:MAG TPA: hypothetical protein VFC44_18325 [Candidatus Saccharimonadales bacterium]|nr:hypothetical protein [Candidatus Saccharimonadales bacterium]